MLHNGFKVLIYIYNEQRYDDYNALPIKLLQCVSGNVIQQVVFKLFFMQIIYSLYKLEMEVSYELQKMEIPRCKYCNHLITFKPFCVIVSTVRVYFHEDCLKIYREKLKRTYDI